MVEPYVTRTYDPSNPSETCYDVLYDSDANKDGLITNGEYSTFVAGLSEGGFNATNYADLPFVIKVNFVYLSCMCRYYPNDEPGTNCCEGPNGGIDVPDGLAPGVVNLTGAEEAYLTTVCSETQGAIEYARAETTPSASPAVGDATSRPMDVSTPTNLPSAFPSNQPTQPPSAEPTTLAPTPPPSAGPTSSVSHS